MSKDDPAETPADALEAARRIVAFYETERGQHLSEMVGKVDDITVARALLAAPKPEGWRTMDSAPKRGEVVDLWCTHFEGDPSRRLTDMTHVECVKPSETGWYRTIGRVILSKLETVLTPTHWMLPPTPPIATDAAAESKLASTARPEGTSNLPSPPSED